MVGFCDFVGVDIAPVSKKTAVKYVFLSIHWILEIVNFLKKFDKKVKELIRQMILFVHIRKSRKYT